MQGFFAAALAAGCFLVLTVFDRLGDALHSVAFLFFGDGSLRGRCGVSVRLLWFFLIA
jgi:hypothetical protein